MSELETKRPQDIKETKWYKKATFPWAIITALIIAVTSFISGYTVRVNTENQVKAEAASMVTSLTKKAPEQK